MSRYYKMPQNQVYSWFLFIKDLLLLMSVMQLDRHFKKIDKCHTTQLLIATTVPFGADNATVKLCSLFCPLRQKNWKNVVEAKCSTVIAPYSANPLNPYSQMLKKKKIPLLFTFQLIPTKNSYTLLHEILATLLFSEIAKLKFTKIKCR